jgi:hypothetical protein
MIPRGEVDLITSRLGWSVGLISPQAYALVAVTVYGTILITLFLLRFCFPFQRLRVALGTPSPPIAELPMEQQP